MMNKKKYADGGQQQLFAYKDVPLASRMGKYFANLITIDDINNVEDIVGERGLTFTLHDPVYGGEKILTGDHWQWYNTQVFYCILIPSFRLFIRIL